MALPLKIFISYTQTDRRWAEWIAWQVETAGHEARIQAWDFAVGGNFVDAMDEAAKWADVTMPVLSPEYLESSHGKAEWSVAFARDPLGKEGRLIPVRVKDFDATGLLEPVVYVDFVGVGAAEARDRLTAGIERRRRKPRTEPAFPNQPEGSEPAPQDEPAYPRAEMIGVPHRNPYFTGREDLLKRLHEQLQAEGSAALAQAAIHGLGGIGKTQTAIEYAYRFEQEYRHILWVAAETETTLGASYTRIARRLELAGDEAKLETVVAAVKAWLAREDGWLLIFDNADDPTLLRDYLPTRREGGRVLLTSRARSFKAVGIRRPARLGTMEPGEAMRFLAQRTERDEPEAAAALATRLGYLPLALEQAAAYVDTVGVSLADYLASFERRGVKLFTKFAPHDYQKTVATTWSVSIEAVERESPASLELLDAAAFLAPDSIPIEIFILGGAELGGELADALQGAGEDPPVFWELLEPLRRYSLVERLPDDAFKLHRLTQEVVKDSLAEEERKAWAERVVRALNAAYPEVEFENWPLCDRLQPHTRPMSLLIRRHNLELTEAARLLNDAGHFAGDRGDHASARAFHEQAQEIRERVLGQEHPQTLTSRNNLATTLQDLGDHAGARDLHEKTLESRERVLGHEHPHTLASRNNLAMTLRALGDHTRARELHEKTLEICESVLGAEHPQTLTSRNNLAATLWALGDHAEARELHEKTLEICERVLGHEHPDTLASRNNLASTLWHLGEGEAAKALFEQVLESYERVLGSEHPDTTRPAWWLLTIAQKDNDADATARWLEKLRWLAEREEESIASVDQRKARRFVLKVMGC